MEELTNQLPALGEDHILRLLATDRVREEQYRLALVAAYEEISRLRARLAEHEQSVQDA